MDWKRRLVINSKLWAFWMIHKKILTAHRMKKVVAIVDVEIKSRHVICLKLSHIIGTEQFITLNTISDYSHQHAKPEVSSHTNDPDVRNDRARGIPVCLSMPLVRRISTRIYEKD